jgi:hypothetical protein
MLLAATILPWTTEWLIHYKLWLITGRWAGGGHTHTTNEAITYLPRADPHIVCWRRHSNVRPRSLRPSASARPARAHPAEGNRRSHKRSAPRKVITKVRLGEARSIARSIGPSRRLGRRAAGPYVRHGMPRFLRCDVKTWLPWHANPIRQRPSRAIRHRSVACRVALLRFRATDKSRTNDQEAGHP